MSSGNVVSFKYYQEIARSTAIYPNIGHNFTYPVLGLCGEAGEVAEKVKKILRDRDGVLSEQDKVEVAKELGDVLWYIAAICSEFGLSMEAVADANAIKLRSRKERGVLQGSGDDR